LNPDIILTHVFPCSLSGIYPVGKSIHTRSQITHLVNIRFLISDATCLPLALWSHTLTGGCLDFAFRDLANFDAIICASNLRTSEFMICRTLMHVRALSLPCHLSSTLNRVSRNCDFSCCDFFVCENPEMSNPDSLGSRATYPNYEQ